MTTLKINKPVANDQSRKPIRGRNRNNHVTPNPTPAEQANQPRSKPSHSKQSDRPHKTTDSRTSHHDKPHRASDRPYGQTKPASQGTEDRPQRRTGFKRPASSTESRSDKPHAATAHNKPKHLNKPVERAEKPYPPKIKAADKAPQAAHRQHQSTTNIDDKPRNFTAASKPKLVGKNFQEPRRHGKMRDETGRIIKEIPPRLAPIDAGIRLSKHLADQGMCSRREADAFIEKGWVTVNGARATLGQRILPSDRIQVARQAERAQESRVTILINKPVGYVSGQAEDGYLPAVSLITPDNHWDEDSSDLLFENKQLRGIAPAGRLDIDSVGLLILTQDGRIAKALISDKSEVDKEYLVRVEGHLTPDGLALLNHGLELDGKPLRPAQVNWQNDDQLRFVLTEGKKRQIRRMCELVGLHVVGLKRIRIGKILLGDLPTGKWRYLRDDEHF